MKKDLLTNDSEQSNVSLIAKAVAFIAANGMKILEVKAYPINDKITRKLKKYTFKAFTLKEVDVQDINSSKKEGYLVLNSGELDYPLAKLKLDEDGPWYFTDKDEAVEKVKRMNEVEYEAIKELQDEVLATEEYMKNIVENDRF